MGVNAFVPHYEKNIRIRHTAIEHIFYAAFRESGVYSYERRHSGGPSELGQRCKMYYHARRPPPDRTGHAATAAYSAVNAPVYRQHGCSSVATSGVGRGIGFGAGCSVSFSTGSSVGCIIVFGVGSSVGRTIAFGAGSIASCSVGCRIGFSLKRCQKCWLRPLVLSTSNLSGDRCNRLDICFFARRGSFFFDRIEVLFRRRTANMVNR